MAVGPAADQQAALAAQRRLEQQRAADRRRADEARRAQEPQKPQAERVRADLTRTFFEGPSGKAPVSIRGDRADQPQAIDTQKIDAAEQSVRADGDGSTLVDQLRGDDLNPAEKRELVARIADSDDPQRYLGNFEEPGEERNYDYDDQRTVVSALGDAYRHGQLDARELDHLVHQLGPDDASRFAGQLALDPRNTGAGGVLEAFGRSAQAAGDQRTAALAFSASPELIQRNLPSDAQQRAAFDQVRGWVTSQHRDDFSNEQQADFTIASANALRLSANGNGWTPEESTAYLKDLGPSLTGEIVSRARNTPGDSAVGGTVDLIGRSATAIAGQTDGDDQKEWKIDAAVANTASPELIRERLSAPGAAAEAFKTLTDAANDQYGSAKDADGHYALLRFPEITEGAAALFHEKTNDIVDAAVNDRDGLSADTLKSFAENVAFSPFTTPEVKQQVKDTLTTWSKAHLGDGSQPDSYQRALEVGQVLGTFQNGAEAALDRVGDDAAAKAKAANETKNFFVDVTSGLVGGGLTLLANPVAGGAATQVSKHLLDQIFPDQDLQQARTDAENGLRDLLEKQGTSANLGQEITQLRNEQIGRALGRINHILRTDPNLSNQDREALQNLALSLQNNRNGLEDGYHRARPE